MRLLRNKKNTPKPYVKCHIIDPSKGFLLLRRAAHDSYAGVWESVGGGVDKGESPLNAVIREVAEESGLEVNPTFQAQLTLNDENSGKPYAASLYVATLNKARVDLSDNPDHDDFIWINEGNYLEFLQSGNKIDSWTLTHQFMQLGGMTKGRG